MFTHKKINGIKLAQFKLKGGFELTQYKAINWIKLTHFKPSDQIELAQFKHSNWINLTRLNTVKGLNWPWLNPVMVQASKMRMYQPNLNQEMVT